MSDYITEEQQLEQLKQWWKKYGMVSIITFLIVLAASFVWRHWQQDREKKLEHASGRYELLLTSVVNNDAAATNFQATRLIERYPRTPYAQLAALMLARQAVHEGKFDVANEKLSWVIDNGKNKSLRQVAKLRRARLLLEQKQPQHALKLLQRVDDDAFMAEINEVRGDILAALGKNTEARDSYLAAEKVFPGLEVARPILEMKMNDLTIAAPAGSAK